MTPKKLYSFKIDAEVAAALKRIKARDGVGESEQIRRGILIWLKRHGVTPKKAEGKRGGTRKRSLTPRALRRSARRRA